MRTEDFERFGEIDPAWRRRYLERPLERLPQDVTAACDELRRQRKEINNLRGQVFRSKIKNGVLTGIVGGLAFKGAEVALVAIFKAFGH